MLKFGGRADPKLALKVGAAPAAGGKVAAGRPAADGRAAPKPNGNVFKMPAP